METNTQLSNLINRWAVKATWTGNRGHEEVNGILSYPHLYAEQDGASFQLSALSPEFIVRTIDVRDRLKQGDKITVNEEVFKVRDLKQDLSSGTENGTTTLVLRQ